MTDGRSDGQAVRSSLWLAVTAAAILGGCSRRPPASFLIDPQLAGDLRSIRILPRVEAACPGGLIPVDYEAVHESGLRMPIMRTYDKRQPPKLHVIFLSRSSPDALPHENGDWVGDPDPLQTAMTGFRLSAFLKANPAVNGSATLEPEYSCMPHAFGFEGEGGGPGESGAGGPDVTVRLGVVRSPYYANLLVASIEVGVAPPIYTMADFGTVPPADWLIVETRGGRGGGGRPGARGQTGADAAAGCPGGVGGAGGAGGPGGPGGPGGRGGRMTVIVPADEPLLAGLVETRSLGGNGGNGGVGGKGGPGGKGGVAQGSPGQSCQAGAAGKEGAVGVKGQDGSDGPFGPRAQVLTVSRGELFGAQVPPELRQLINYTGRDQ